MKNVFPFLDAKQTKMKIVYKENKRKKKGKLLLVRIRNGSDIKKKESGSKQKEDGCKGERTKKKGLGGRGEQTVMYSWGDR